MLLFSSSISQNFQVIFDRFYDERSGRDPEGLFALKKLLGANQVKPDIRKNYHAASHFLNKVLDSLLLVVLDDKLGHVDLEKKKADYNPDDGK